MSDTLRVSLIQTDLHWQDGAANREMFAKKLEPLRSKTDLIVLPEVFSTGFTNNTEVTSGEDAATTLAWMKQSAKRCNAALYGSVVQPVADGFTNRGYFVEPDGKVSHYDKVHLFRMADEHKRYQAGSERVCVEFRGWKILLTVCYDLRFPVFNRNKALADGQLEYDLMLCVANWPKARALPWRALLQARAIENLSYVAGVNRIGVDGNDLEYSGDSMLLDYSGKHLIDHPGSVEFVETVTLSIEELDLFRKKFPAHLDADNFSLELR